MTARSVATVTARLRPAKCKRPLCAPLRKRAAPRAGAAGFLFWRHSIDLIKGHQPAGKRIGSQGQAQGLSQEAKDAMARILSRTAAAQA